MKVCRWSCWLLAGLLVSVAPQVHAQGVRSVYFWNSAGGSPGVKVAPWGNGLFSEAKDVGGPGDRPLQVTTRSLQEGVRFDLPTPVLLAPYQAAGLLRFRVRFRETGLATPTGAEPGGFVPGGFPPGPGTGGFPGPPQNRPLELMSPRLMTRASAQATLRLAQFGNNGPGGGGPGGGFPGGPGGEGGAPGFGGPAEPAPQETSITRLQVALMLDKGVAIGTIPINLDKTKADEEGWRFYALPVKNMRLTPNAGTLVQRLVLTSDTQDTFYVGELALVAETGDMSVAIRRPTDAVGAPVAEITVKPGPVTLVADVEAGAADPAVEWNFDADNAGAPPAQGPVAPGPEGGFPGPPGGPGAPGQELGTPGQRIDAHGPQGKFDYPNEEQNYRVEVTVRDRSGKKKPVKASILVKVRA